MQTGTKSRGFFSRQPLSAFSKAAVVTFFGMIVITGIMAFFATPSQVIFVGSVMLVSGVCILTRIRWAPLVGTLITGLLLYVFLFKEPVPTYYLIHPKDALNTTSLSFTMFVIDVFFLWGMMIAFGCSTAALIKNYWRRDAGTPRWFTSVGGVLIGLLLGALLVGSFVPSPGTAMAATGTRNQPLLVQMNGNQFTPSSVTLTAGGKIVLLDTGYFQHTISYGAWVNGQPQFEKESNAPSVSHEDINGPGRTFETDNFETPGVYHLFCEHTPGMTLTIIVQ